MRLLAEKTKKLEADKTTLSTTVAALQEQVAQLCRTMQVYQQQTEHRHEESEHVRMRTHTGPHIPFQTRRHPPGDMKIRSVTGTGGGAAATNRAERFSGRSNE